MRQCQIKFKGDSQCILLNQKLILFLILTCAILLTGCSSQGAKIGQYDTPYSYVAENSGSIMIKNVHTAEQFILILSYRGVLFTK
ncbi:MAG: hypothetical protein RSE96_10590, partial [Niameybacter sp.]